MLKEKVSVGKLASVFICVLGVVAVSFFGSRTDKDDDHNTTALGYVWVLASTVTYALSETLYGKVVFKGELDMSFNFLFLGFVGLFTFFVFWPGLLILDTLKLEILELPTGQSLWSLVVTILLDVIFNGAFFVGIYSTSPLFMGVGSLLTIPVSVVVDLILNNYILPIPAFFGILGIIVGFLGLNLSEIFADKLLEDYDDIEPGHCFRQFGKLIVQDIRLCCKSKSKTNNISWVEK